eukprot:jgi/Tetstr1/420792/TSEL_011868.t1
MMAMAMRPRWSTEARTPGQPQPPPAPPLRCGSGGQRCWGLRLGLPGARRRGCGAARAAPGKDRQGRSVNWVRDGDMWEDSGEMSGEISGELEESLRPAEAAPGQELMDDTSFDDADCDIAWSGELLSVREKLEDLREAVGLPQSLVPIDYTGSTEGVDLDSLSALRTQVDRLKAVVFKQREVIRQLQSTVAAAQLSNAQAPPQPVMPTPAPREGPPPWAPPPLQPADRPFEAAPPPPRARQPISDRRKLGGFDARFHSTSAGATPADFRVLPARIILVRHGESYEDDMLEYSAVPDPRIPLTDAGRQQAREAGAALRAELSAAYGGRPFRTFFYTSPYLRSSQTFQCISEAMFGPPAAEGESQPLFAGMREEVQLREQDFGNFQDPGMRMRKRSERKRFGRFFYRFPNGESGADLYDRITIFQDHLVRDINAGRFSQDTNLVLVTHGLALRVFLMRWFHWTVDELLQVQNPPHASTIVLERIPSDEEARPDGPVAWMHTKALYRLSRASADMLEGCSDEMCRATSPMLLSVKPAPQGMPSPSSKRDT